MIKAVIIAVIYPTESGVDGRVDGLVDGSSALTVNSALRALRSSTDDP